MDVLEVPDNVIAQNTDIDAEAKRADQRLQRMSQVISKFASTLVLKPIDVRLSTEVDAPAWSSSDTIYFNSNKVSVPKTADDVIHVKGLGLHEIAHIMMTPSVGTKLGKRVKDAKLWRAFNALEDQRIEMWMVSRFSNVSDWLCATIANYLLDEVENYKTMFPLVHGRKYLPLELRNQVRAMFVEQDKADEIGSLIDEYIQLNVMDHKTYDRAFEIIERYSELVNDLFSEVDPDAPWYVQEGWDGIPDINGHEHRDDDAWNVKPMTKKQADPIVDKVNKAVSADRKAQSLPQPINNMPSTKSPNTNGQQVDVPGGNSAGKDAGTEHLRDIASKIVKDVIQRNQLDISKALKQFSGEIELNSRRLPDPPSVYVRNHLTPSASATLAVKRFASELLQLKAKYDPGWERKTEVGKLNVQRYATGCELDEAFDQWDLGREDAVDIEAVLLVDNSGSMYSNMPEACESMWAIKRALDKVGASTTVVTFNHKEQLLYKSTSRATQSVPYVGAGGGTSPLDSLRYARSVFANSNRAIKILVPITDGYWDNADACNSIIRQLRNANVITALGMIGASTNDDGKYVIDAHNCEVAVAIDDMTQLFQLAKGMVKVGIARNLSK
jgi:hypothetical protein